MSCIKHIYVVKIINKSPKSDNSKSLKLKLTLSKNHLSKNTIKEEDLGSYREPITRIFSINSKLIDQVMEYLHS